MPDKILHNFLDRQAAEGVAFAAESDVIALKPLGAPPHMRYLLHIRAKGLVKPRDGAVRECGSAVIGLQFGPDYLRRVEPWETMHCFSPLVFHPNFQYGGSGICVHIRPGTPLVLLIITAVELWTYQKWTTGDGGLNQLASAYVRTDPSRFPLERPVLRRQPEAP